MNIRNINSIIKRKKNINIISYISILITYYNYQMINRNNISLYLLLFLTYFLLKSTTNIKPNNTINIFAIIFAILLTFGNPEMIRFSKVLYLVASIIGLFTIFQRFFYYLKTSINKLIVNNNSFKNSNISKKKFIMISMILGLIFYLPYLLKFFPGLSNSDGYNQILQLQGIIPYSNHHPIVHTMIIKFWYMIGYTLTKKEIVGVAFYTIFQMFFVSYVYSYVVYSLYKNKINKYLIILIWLFFFLYPFNAIYAITMWKDIMFSTIVLWFIMYIWNHYNEKVSWNKKNKIHFILFGIAICLLRTNGLLGYILFLIIMYFVYKKEFLALKKPILIILIASIAIRGPLYSILNIQRADFVESLSIPIQQVAYVIRNDGRISKQEMKDIKKIADVKQIKTEKDNWRAQFVSDPVKDNIRKNDTNHYLEKNKGKYLKIWLSIGIKNPNKYIRAWIKQTNGYWYYNVDPYIVYVLNTQTYNQREGYQLNFEQHDYLPKIVSNSLQKYIDKVTVLYYNTWSPAMGLYLTIIALFIFVQRKKSIIPCILNITLVLTLLIATPVSCEFRYAYNLFLSGWVLIILSLNNIKTNKSRS